MYVYSKLRLKSRLAYTPALARIYKEHLADKNKANLWLLTLTKPALAYDKLSEEIDTMDIVWRYIYGLAVRDCELKSFKGLRKLEITFSPKKDLKDKPKNLKDYLYHPHYHIIVQGESNCLFIKNKWLSLFPEAKKWEQKAYSIGDSEHNNRLKSGTRSEISELIKCITLPLELRQYNTPNVSHAQRWVHKITHKMRVFVSFGGLKKASEIELSNWVKDNENELFLTKFLPVKRTLIMLKNLALRKKIQKRLIKLLGIPLEGGVAKKLR